MSYENIRAIAAGNAYSQYNTRIEPKKQGRAEQPIFPAGEESAVGKKHVGRTERANNNDFALIGSYGSTRGINAKDTAGLDGNPYATETTGNKLLTYC